MNLCLYLFIYLLFPTYIFIYIYTCVPKLVTVSHLPRPCTQIISFTFLIAAFWQTSQRRFLVRPINAALRSWIDRWHTWCATTQKRGALKQGAKPVISRRWSNHKYSSSDAIAQWTHCKFVCLYITASRNTFGMQDLLDTLNIPSIWVIQDVFPSFLWLAPKKTVWSCLVSCFGGLAINVLVKQNLLACGDRVDRHPSHANTGELVRS